MKSSKRNGGILGEVAKLPVVWWIVMCASCSWSHNLYLKFETNIRLLKTLLLPHVHIAHGIQQSKRLLAELQLQRHPWFSFLRHQDDAQHKLCLGSV
jgi:hypothetical protein